MNKKIILAGLFLLLALGLGIIYFIKGGERIPSGAQGIEAEKLAIRVKRTINKTAWDSTHYIKWTFRGKHHYLWDKVRHMAEVQWDDYRAVLDINTRAGIVYKGGQKITDTLETEKQIDRAYAFFINDAYWLNAPATIFNDDVRKEFIPMDDGYQGLLVTYLSGGITPGDSYLWKIDPKGRPVSYKMWVKILPRGGVEASWEDWIQLNSGAWISTSHKTKLGTIKITNLEDSQYLLSFRKSDPFAELEKKK